MSRVEPDTDENPTKVDRRDQRLTDALVEKLQKGISRNRTVSIATISAVVAFMLGVVSSTVIVLDRMEGVAIKATLALRASDIVPLRNDFDDHVKTTKEAMSPTGVMGTKMAHIESVLAYLVNGMGALCAAEPRAACPKPGQLINGAPQ